jgi:hypothetical protein
LIRLKLTEEDKNIFFEDITIIEVQNYLLDGDLLDVFPFLMEKKNIDDLHLWLTTYLEGREYSINELEGWITKFAIIRQKRLNGGY